MIVPLLTAALLAQAALRNRWRGKVATLNLGNGTDDQVTAGLTRIAAAGARVICCQEAGDRHGAIAEFLRAHPSWTCWFGDGSAGASSVPILWDSTLGRLTAAVTTPAVPRMRIGRPGAGPATAKAKVVNRIRLQLAGRRGLRGRLHVLNEHQLPSVTRRGLSNIRARLAHYRRYIAVTVRVIEMRTGMVVLGMDANAEPGFPLLDPLEHIGLHQMTDEDTHGNRRIDLVFGRGVRAVDVDVIELAGFDHDGVVVDLAEHRAKKKPTHHREAA